jgi:hypothetical protein
MRPLEPRYDIALSFAGEQRQYVEAVAGLLRDGGIKVFYDDYEKTALWGKDLYRHLDYVYREASRFCILFISETYAAKVWTNHERQGAQARALEENGEYILPARFDDTEIPGLRPTVGYLDLTDLSPSQLADRIKEKLGPRPTTRGFPRSVDRLYKSMRLRDNKGKNKQRRKEVRDVAHSFYDALSRMNDEERRSVAGVMAFGCKAELPDRVHISLDYLSRMIGLPPAQIMASLGSVRSLNVFAALRDPVHEPLEAGSLTADDRDVVLEFWSHAVPKAKDSTTIAYKTVHSAAKHFCAEHGLETICSLDFHLLSKSDD